VPHSSRSTWRDEWEGKPSNEHAVALAFLSVILEGDPLLPTTPQHPKDNHHPEGHGFSRANKTRIADATTLP
jgi:hypothetical protein